MNRPRLRFTIRRVIVLVAIVAIVLGWAEARRRWSLLTRDYRLKATMFALSASLEESEAATAETAPWFARASSPSYPENVGPEHRRRAARYFLLQQKYERAADRPWWPVEPDPADLPIRSATAFW